MLYFYQLPSNLVHIICQFYHRERYLRVEILVSLHIIFDLFIIITLSRPMAYIVLIIRSCEVGFTLETAVAVGAMEIYGL